jgi:hypothetical protein
MPSALCLFPSRSRAWRFGVCNPLVTGGYSLWTKVRRKGKGPPWPGGPGGPLGTMRRWFLRGRGGGQGLPPPLAEAQSVHRGYGPPGRCFRRVPPEPPGHNKACTPPLFTEGLRQLGRKREEQKIEGRPPSAGMSASMIGVRPLFLTRRRGTPLNNSVTWCLRIQTFLGNRGLD